jgi:hypothetical protein
MLAAVALVGCNREDTPVSPQEQHVIGFGSVDTRADKSDLQRDGFGVWACVSSKDVAQSVQYEPLLENELVSYDKDYQIWTYENTEYWITNSYHYFLASYPTGAFTQHRVSYDGEYITYYTMDVTADGSDETADILVATNVTDTTIENYPETVSLQFYHLLSKINLKIRQDFKIDPDFNYYVTKVVMEGAKGNGIYWIDPYNGNFYDEWNLDEAKNVTIEKTFQDPVLLRNIGAEDPVVTLSVWEDGLMLIPQSIFNGGVKVRVEYYYDIDLNDDDLGSKRFVEGFIPATTWESGKSLSYTLSIANQNNITFSQPTIDPWGSPQTGGTIIIQ